jgi:hypothetical protein
MPKEIPNKNRLFTRGPYDSQINPPLFFDTLSSLKQNSSEKTNELSSIMERFVSSIPNNIQYDKAAINEMMTAPFENKKTKIISDKPAELQFIIDYQVGNRLRDLFNHATILNNNPDIVRTIGTLKDKYGVEFPYGVKPKCLPFFSETHVQPPNTEKFAINDKLQSAFANNNNDPPDNKRLTGYLVTNNVPHTSCFILDKESIIIEWVNLNELIDQFPAQMNYFSKIAMKIFSSYFDDIAPELLQYTNHNMKKHKMYPHFKTHDNVFYDKDQKIKIDSSGKATCQYFDNTNQLKEFTLCDSNIWYPVASLDCYNCGLGFGGDDKNAVNKALKNYTNRLTPTNIQQMIRLAKHGTSVIDACLYSIDRVASLEESTRVSYMFPVTNITKTRIEEFMKNITGRFHGSTKHENYYMLNPNVFRYCELISIIPENQRQKTSRILTKTNPIINHTEISTKFKEIYNIDVNNTMWNNFVAYINTVRETVQLWNCMTWAEYICNAKDKLDPNCRNPKTCPGLDYLVLISVELHNLERPDYTSELGGGKSTRKSSRKSNKKNKRRSNRRSTRKN